MFSRKQIVVLTALLVAGLGLALELLHIDYMVNYSSEPFRSFCNINDTFNCDAVAASPYSHLFGIPIAFIGVSGNVILLVFLFVGSRLEHLRVQMKNIYTFILWLYAFGCAGLATISFLLVPALCFVCMAFWGTSILTFIYVAALSNGSWRKPTELIRAVFTAIRQHKVATLGLLGLFVATNAYAGYRFSYCGCNIKGKQALECEGFDSRTFSAYLGRSSAKIDVVIYTDFQCPWCKRAHYAVMDMVEKHEKQVRFVRKDFPLDMSCNPLIKQPFHNVACKAAFFARCAGMQGKYWEYHDELYKNQEILSEQVFENIAKMLSLDLDALRTCAKSDAVQASVQRDIEEAARYQVNGTPAFRIFGELQSGMINDQVIEDYVASYPAIKATVLRRIVEGNAKPAVQIIDVRESSQFEKKRIEGALNIPLARLQSALSTQSLKTSEPTLLYDQDGREVNKAFEIFKNRGFTSLHTLSGGFDSFDPIPTTESAKWVSPEEALKLLQGGLDHVLDLRTQEEYRAFRIKGAKHIPIDELPSRVSELDAFKNQELLIYCRTNNKSRAAMKFLREQGFSRLIIIKDGMEAWKQARLPVEKGDAP